MKCKIERRGWSCRRLFANEPVRHGVKKLAGPDTESSGQLQNHLQAGLFFAVFQAAYERMHYIHPFAQLFLGEPSLQPV